MIAPQTPGVYRTETLPSPLASLSTGVAAILGLSTEGDLELPRRLRLWSQFGESFGGSPPAGKLAAAVEGFFANGGETCFVVRLDETAADPVSALRRGLAAIADLEDVDLVCLPDASRLRPVGETPESPHEPARVHALQAEVIAHCEHVETRIAILDALPNAGQAAVLEQRRGLTSANATLYYPWISVRADGAGAPDFVPPCGHVAGIYARTDRLTGVHKAPANEVLRGVLDLELNVTNDLQAGLNPVGVNCLRAFPGRGIRVWGARTLSTDTAWTYVNVRRLILTVARWVGIFAAPLVFEPRGEALWRRIRRELSAYLTGLYRAGALQGASAGEAFFVRCDAETNAAAGQGEVVVEIGLVVGRPNEFIVVHVVHEAGGVSVTGPHAST